jgi:uncharacterized protein with HEPN domain
MKHPERVEDYLEHMAEAAGQAIEYLQHIDKLEDFRNDRRNQDAAVRNIEIIGEAANNIERMAPGFAAAHPQLPWKEIRGMRNVVIHEYFVVDVARVWGTVKTNLPQLTQQINALLLELRLAEQLTVEDEQNLDLDNGPKHQR